MKTNKTRRLEEKESQGNTMNGCSKFHEWITKYQEGVFFVGGLSWPVLQIFLATNPRTNPERSGMPSWPTVRSLLSDRCKHLGGSAKKEASNCKPRVEKPVC